MLCEVALKPGMYTAPVPPQILNPSTFPNLGAHKHNLA